MNQEQWLGLLRDFLKIIGAMLMAKGAVTTVDWTTYTGLILTAAPMVWGLYEKTRARMIAKVDAMPGVKGVVTANSAEGADLAASVPSETVVTAGTTAAAAIAR